MSVSEATSARSQGRSLRVVLSDEDRASLQQLSQRNPAWTSRVDVILASARGEPLEEIARATGLSRTSVTSWRTRFLHAGVLGLSEKTPLSLTDEQRDELTSWRNGADPVLQKRAIVLLEVAKTGEISAAASKAGVAVGTAKRWRMVYKIGGRAALVSELKRKSLSLEVSDAERDTLLGWMESPALARKAKALLALAEGADLHEAAERAGAVKRSVIAWREGFVASGLSGLTAKRVFTVTADQRLELERVKVSSPAEVAKRAAVLLELADAGSLERVAAIEKISARSIRQWSHAFQRAGAGGLEHPKTAVTAGIQKIAPAVRLSAAMEIHAARRIAVSGETISITSEEATIALRERPPIPADAVGCRVTAEIQWPVARESGEPIVLWAGGILTEVSPGRMTMRLRRVAFEARPSRTGSGAANSDKKPPAKADLRLRPARRRAQ